MTYKKANWNIVNDFVIRKLKEDIEHNCFHEMKLKLLIEEVYPFSWSVFCKYNKLNPKLREIKNSESTKGVKRT